VIFEGHCVYSLRAPEIVVTALPNATVC